MIYVGLFSLVIIVIVIVALAGFTARQSRHRPGGFHGYDRTVRLSVVGLCSTLVISLLAFALTRSYELAMSFGLFLLSCVALGAVVSLIFEHKVRGGSVRKVD
jgi:hypothetical protein